MLLHGVRKPPPFTCLWATACPLLSLWEAGGEEKTSGLWLSGSVLADPERGRRQRKTHTGEDVLQSTQITARELWGEKRQRDESH